MSSLKRRHQAIAAVVPPRCSAAPEVAVGVASASLDGMLRHYRPLVGRTRARAECLALIRGEGPEVIREALAKLPVEWADHAIASIYAVLMPHARRKELGAYFTPPHLVEHLLYRMTALGLNICNDVIRDPAAGGAAFLVPLARRMVAAWRADGLSDRCILELLRSRLSGTEVDRGLADIANALLRRMLVSEWEFRPSDVQNLTIVMRANALTSRKRRKTATHEVGNPPYRRLSAVEHTKMQARFADISSGRLNLYAMFMRRALEDISPGGLVAHVVPASFLGGPEFSAFRRRLLELAEVLVIDLIDQRGDVFVDATQDACFAVLRRRPKICEAREAHASSGVLHADGHFTPATNMHLRTNGEAWPLPGSDSELTCVLADWGYRATVGHIVPFRQKERMFERYAKHRYPLIWARCISQDGTFNHAFGLSATRRGWVSAPDEASYVIRTPCVVMQRTSSRDQKRRVIAAAIPSDFMSQYGGVVGENHVLILTKVRADAPQPEELAAALNQPTVSRSMNRMCGSASIPLAALKVLRLPPPRG